MKRYFYSPLIFVLFLPVILYTQSIGTVSGKLVDQNGNGLPGLQLNLYINPNIYQTTSSSNGSFIFTSVTGVKDEQLPTGYAVSNNYPNPFNPKTRISITLPNSGNVRVDVYNLLGQRVCDEIEKYFNAGDSYVDLELNGLPNGFYLARITLDEKYTVTKKLMLMYGSQHLSSSSGGLFSRINKTTMDGNSILDTNLDSLVATSSIIGRKAFKNLPSMVSSSLNLGNLTLDRFCAGIPTVTYAGKTYHTIQIGNQCWLKENLDVGTMIQGILSANNNNTIEKYCYDNNPNNCATYGGLYQWNEAMAYSTTPGTKGICPDGWHIPTLAEFQTLGTTVSNNSESLKEVGQGAGTNTSGFSVLLGGFRSYGGGFYNLRINAGIWSSTELDATYAYLVGMDINGGTFSIGSNGLKADGDAVRCIKDESLPPSAPTLSTPTNNSVDISVSPTLSWNVANRATSYTLQVSTNNSFSSFVYNQSVLNSTTQQLSGLSYSTTYYWRVSATNNYGTSVYSIPWSFTTLSTAPAVPILSSPTNNAVDVSVSPTLTWTASTTATSYTLQVSTKNDFSTLVINQSGLINTNQLISGLYSTAKYYWQVSATNSYGTSNWSNYWIFTTVSGPSGPCPGIPTVLYTGKTYNTVQIGTQCWLKENLDVGAMIQVNQNPSNNGTIEKYCYDNNPNNCATYGGLYQWNEAMAYSTTPGAQGICPTGWHIPTKTEFETLAATVKNDGEALKANGTNTSGFSGLLAGFRYDSGNFYNFGYETFFWSSTEYDSSSAYYLSLTYLLNRNTYFYYNYKGYGYSVRCLKD
ncbi:MAG: FISUMP domain-containing protein [Melioribacteraceae bacterium]